MVDPVTAAAAAAAGFLLRGTAGKLLQKRRASRSGGERIVLGRTETLCECGHSSAYHTDRGSCAHGVTARVLSLAFVQLDRDRPCRCVRYTGPDVVPSLFGPGAGAFGFAHQLPLPPSGGGGVARAETEQ